MTWFGGTYENGGTHAWKQVDGEEVLIKETSASGEKRGDRFT